MKENFPQRKYCVFGIIGCLCFGIGDWLLGVVDTAEVEGDVFYFIREGHGAEYSMTKLSTVFLLAVVGICFLYSGFVHISDIGKNDKTKRLLRFVFGLCSTGWLIIHFIVAANVFIFSQADNFGGRELAFTLSKGFSRVGTEAFYIGYLFVLAAIIVLPAAIFFGKTCLKKTAAFFTPAVPMAIIFAAAELLPDSPFAYGLFTFCMNGGMITWFIYLLFQGRNKNKKENSQ